MIHAQKSGLFSYVVDSYVTWKFRRSFRALWVRGELPSASPGIPRLFYVNHSNFWDGFVVHQLARAAGWNGYCMMDEANLSRFRFLRHLGAFSIRRNDAQSSLETFRYVRKLARRNAAVFLFPEGEFRSFGSFPLRLERGIEVLSAAGGFECVPVGIRYQFFEGELADVLVEMGTAHAPTTVADFAQRLEDVVRTVALAPSVSGFRQLVKGRRGIAEWWAHVRGYRA